jgi:hypothetical protein|tara:strand:+ start:1310 stop:2296 length:987 start_codon:yes stop_codon:yes gene_type:complete
MAQTTINVGSNANDGTGDDLRSAFIAVNENFTELYAASPVTSQITLEGNSISTNTSNANLKLIANGTGVLEFEAIQIRDNHIEATRSNDNLILSASGTGNIILGAITINGTTISSADSTAININSSDTLNVSTVASGGGGDVTFNSDIAVDTIKLNTVESSDSTAIQINDALNISGTLSADTIDTNVISSTDSSAVTIADNLQVNGTLSATTITGLSVLNHSSQSDGVVIHSGSSAAQPLDSFPIATYRSAKYSVSITDTTNSRYAMDELHITHDGSTAYISSTGVSSTGSSLVTYSVDISSGQLRVLMVPISSDSVTYKFVRTVINV